MNSEDSVEIDIAHSYLPVGEPGYGGMDYAETAIQSTLVVKLRRNDSIEAIQAELSLRRTTEVSEELFFGVRGLPGNIYYGWPTETIETELRRLLNEFINS